MQDISIHALREEGDPTPSSGIFTALIFLSTPSARRATRPLLYPQRRRLIFLSTPSARRATRRLQFWSWDISISIHALREEGDAGQGRGARFPVISIHALREEGDNVVADFNHHAVQFLSTPSARRATAKTERKHPAFVSLYTSLHKLQRDACKTNRKITPLLAQTAGIPVRSVPENHVCCRFALAGHQKISTLSWANSGCSPTCSTFVW